MEQTRQNKHFPFYEFYAEILRGLTDEEAGRMTKRMCAYMFTHDPVVEIKDAKERFYWGNLVDVLEESKESAAPNRRMKHFGFQENFYDALQLLDDKQGGQYVKAICGYMFEDKIPTLRPPLDGFFTLAKRKLDLSKMRRKVGSKGGNTERIPVTKEQFPRVKNDIYKSSVHLAVGVDWTTLADELPSSSYRDSTSLYQILSHYREIVG